MIDLHTHTLLSDGDLLPSELVRRAAVNGVKVIAITDHADHSNIEFVIDSLTRAAKALNKFWDIRVIPGVELTHIPLETIEELTKLARRKGAKIVVMHGESPVEPVIPGTNRRAIEAGVDILAHPGYIKEEDVALAKVRGVHLEITTRRGHNLGNKHVFTLASTMGAKMVLDTDSHTPE
ncbi:MAG: histidinol phosphate phosphatase domain-containing protein, partial [Candidatus Omnitrophica bacterium]|nr:histidinol phosphate phosphatase domain-containing protein [Candidatus Omnitrophota bacterium]